jgi:hypothetical protein
MAFLANDPSLQAIGCKITLDVVELDQGFDLSETSIDTGYYHGLDTFPQSFFTQPSDLD